MKLNLSLSVIICFLVSCQVNEIQNVSIKGELLAKNLIRIGYDLPEQVATTEFSWYISPSRDGEWEKLPGIWSDEIVLLTSYAGSYLKCEIACTMKSGKIKSSSVVSPEPVEYKGNPNTDWFKEAGFGIMLHYLKPVFAPEGGSKEWNDAVNRFDAEIFAGQAADAGAGYVLFTLGQNSGYYCSPNSVYDSIMEVQSGVFCSNRDLPMDLMQELEKRNIPLLLYLPSNPPISNKLVSEKFRYLYRKDSATSQYNQPILEAMIREWGMRYGKGVKGWWFDGLYDWNGIRSTRMDMSLKHNISTHTLAAKAGNKNRIVTYNSGFGPIYANTPYCDYTSGEKPTIDEFPSGRWAEDGVQWFLFTYLGEKWGGKGQQFDTDTLVSMAQKIVENEGVLCLEVVTEPTGEILPHHLEQIIEVGRGLGKVR